MPLTESSIHKSRCFKSFARMYEIFCKIKCVCVCEELYTHAHTFNFAENLKRGKHLSLDSQRCQDPKGVKNHSNTVLENKVLFHRGDFFFLGFQGTWQASTRWNSENNIMAEESVLIVCPSAVSKRYLQYLAGWLLDFW